MRYDDDFHIGYAFETRNGLRGIVQCAGLNTTPRSIKIRYRLAQVSPAAGFSFGPAKHGLQAGLVLRTADNNGYALGQAIEDLLVIRNASNNKLDLTAEIDEPTVADDKGQKHTIFHVHGAGSLPTRKCVLEADETATIKGSGLKFISEDMDVEKVASSVRYYVKVKPGAIP